MQHGKSFIIPYSKELYDGDNVNKTYWETLFDNIKPYTSGNGQFEDIEHINQLLLIKHPVYHEKSFNYKLIEDGVDNVCFNGLFQSYKYFNDNKDKLILLFNIEHKQTLIRSEYFEYLDKHNTVSMHFMFGDEQDSNPVLCEDYYDKSLSLIPDDYRVLIFSNKQYKEQVDAIMDELKLKHKHEFVYVSYEIEDWKQMLLMSLCRINIISNNSFSWWGAYFNKYPDKVYYPSLWFGSDFKDNTNDLFLPEWEIVEL
jgi:hypothetical protein